MRRRFRRLQTRGCRTQDAHDPPCQPSPTSSGREIAEKTGAKSGSRRASFDLARNSPIGLIRPPRMRAALALKGDSNAPKNLLGQPSWCWRCRWPRPRRECESEWGSACRSTADITADITADRTTALTPTTGTIRTTDRMEPCMWLRPRCTSQPARLAGLRATRRLRSITTAMHRLRRVRSTGPAPTYYPAAPRATRSHPARRVSRRPARISHPAQADRHHPHKRR